MGVETDLDRIAYRRVPAILIKIVVALLAGGLTFAATSLNDQPTIWAVSSSILIGGVTLLTQFLVDLERRLQVMDTNQQAAAADLRAAVLDRFDRISPATALFGTIERSELTIEPAAEMARTWASLQEAHPTLRHFARAEVRRALDVMTGLSRGTATYRDGEDRDWLLDLVRTATKSIDATSTINVDVGSRGVFGTDGFWTSELGRRYLLAQSGAVRRGVAVRRIFILSGNVDKLDADLIRTCAQQHDMGIQVKVIQPRSIQLDPEFWAVGYVLFDGAIGYEVTPRANVLVDSDPIISATRLHSDPLLTGEQQAVFEALWDQAFTIPPGGAG